MKIPMWWNNAAWFLMGGIVFGWLQEWARKKLERQQAATEDTLTLTIWEEDDPFRLSLAWGRLYVVLSLGRAGYVYWDRRGKHGGWTFWRAPEGSAGK